MFNSGLTRCGQSAGRSTWTDKVVDAGRRSGLVELGQSNGQPAAFRGGNREILPLGVGLGRQDDRLGVVVEVEVDLGGHGVVDVQDDAQCIDRLRARQRSW